MSLSKHERGDYIRARMEHKALFLTGQPDATERFVEVWDLIVHGLTTAGNPRTLKCAEHPFYRESLTEWQKAHEAEVARMMKSRSL